MATQQEVLEAYREAALKFVTKVKERRARSVETYSDLKAALEKHDELDKEADNDGQRPLANA